ncbi:hypothetical protein Sxan_78240 [Streptomyces xanthophaeus]|uniref:Uncharacterized protein n=1 Tax=Streptomyces xanthophaeus TaxID=67385 RepID=A0A919H4V9_9ACTN|nr:hypothetical protein Sxan_78240 [Streptomyces xanthophaeus]
MEASVIAAGVCVVAYVSRCLMVWFRARRESESAVSQHRAGMQMVKALPTGSRVRMRSAAGDEVTIEVGQKASLRERVPRGG